MIIFSFFSVFLNTREGELHHRAPITLSWNYKIWALICFDVPHHQNLCPGAMTRYKNSPINKLLRNSFEFSLQGPDGL